MSHFMTADHCALLFIDWQERLFPAMAEGVRDTNLKHAVNLHWLARKLNVPVLFTEQYPKGLGRTLQALDSQAAFEKTSFSAMHDPNFAKAVSQMERKTLILSGMETHICVAQTARDLRAAGYTVVVPADAVLSRRKLDWKMGLQRMVSVGCRLDSAEGILFEWVGQAGTPIFKELSKRIR